MASYNVGTVADFYTAMQAIAANQGGNDKIILTADIAFLAGQPPPISKNVGFRLEVDGAGHEAGHGLPPGRRWRAAI